MTIKMLVFIGILAFIVIAICVYMMERSADMAEFVEVIKQKSRMCNPKNMTCYQCELSASKNGSHVLCEEFMRHYPEKYEKVIMDWAKEHPIKTNADKFKEVFGFEVMSEGKKCIGIECDYNRFGEIVPCKECSKYHFWEKEYVELDKEKEE